MAHSSGLRTLPAFQLHIHSLHQGKDKDGR
jgi:hypothetical protein